MSYGGEPEDDVPVYESLYPELEEQCAHPNCENESPTNDRLCGKCVPIMRDAAPNECKYCGQQRMHRRRTEQES